MIQRLALLLIVTNATRDLEGSLVIALRGLVVGELGLHEEAKEICRPSLAGIVTRFSAETGGPLEATARLLKVRLLPGRPRQLHPRASLFGKVAGRFGVAEHFLVAGEVSMLLAKGRRTIGERGGGRHQEESLQGHEP